jgi:hypothetical protein
MRAGSGPVERKRDSAGREGVSLRRRVGLVSAPVLSSTSLFGVARSTIYRARERAAQAQRPAASAAVAAPA